MDSKFWDGRYSETDGLAYGEAANEFLVQTIQGDVVTDVIKKGGKVLCIAEGEGRNAIYLAQQGFRVHAMDYSSVGMEKLRQRAVLLGISDLITTEVADLNTFDFRKDCDADGWDIIISIFAHTDPALRQKVHAGVVSSLKPGGLFVLEAYHPNNIGRGTGGPHASPMCVTTEDLAADGALVGLTARTLAHLERPVNEGKYHQGLASVVQYIGQKTPLT